MWALRRFGIRQVDSVIARAALVRDEADVPPEWGLDVEAVTDAQVNPNAPTAYPYIRLWDVGPTGQSVWLPAAAFTSLLPQLVALHAVCQPNTVAVVCFHALPTRCELVLLRTALLQKVSCSNML